MKTPIVSYITPEKEAPKIYSKDEQFRISLDNVINNASWKLTDILLVKASLMSAIINSKASSSPFDINPKIIIIDEFDELISNPLSQDYLV